MCRFYWSDPFPSLKADSSSMRNRFEPQRCRACSQGTDGIGSAPCHQNQYELSRMICAIMCSHYSLQLRSSCSKGQMMLEPASRTVNGRGGIETPGEIYIKRSASGTVPCCAKHVLASFRLELQEPFFRPRSNSEGPESLHWPAEARRASCTQAVRQSHLADLNFDFRECSRKLSGQVTSSNFVVEFSLDARCILLLPSWSSSCQAEFTTRILRIRWNSRGIPSNLSCKDLPLYQDIATETNLRQPSFRVEVSLEPRSDAAD